MKQLKESKKFESCVKDKGNQTLKNWALKVKRFESCVKDKGNQTSTYLLECPDQFESCVKDKGNQTKVNEYLAKGSLRAV